MTVHLPGYNQIFEDMQAKLGYKVASGGNLDCLLRVFASAFAEQNRQIEWILNSQTIKPVPSNTKDYPHVCDCGSPAWRGLNIECSNPSCLHHKSSNT